MILEADRPLTTPWQAYAFKMSFETWGVAHEDLQHVRLVMDGADPRPEGYAK